MILLGARTPYRLDRAGRDGVLIAGGDRDDLPLGPAQRGELPPEHAPRVDAERVVEPLDVRHRRVPEHDGGLPAVVSKGRAVSASEGRSFDVPAIDCA